MFNFFLTFLFVLNPTASLSLDSYLRYRVAKSKPVSKAWRACNHVLSIMLLMQLLGLALYFFYIA
jgi:small neutral amino acid transporter SnatA (MarC family)